MMDSNALTLGSMDVMLKSGWMRRNTTIRIEILSVDRR
jgi:hypothetical protein